MTGNGQKAHSSTESYSRRCNQGHHTKLLLCVPVHGATLTRSRFPGDTVRVRLDLDAKTLEYFINGSSQVGYPASAFVLSLVSRWLCFSGLLFDFAGYCVPRRDWPSAAFCLVLPDGHSAAAVPQINLSLFSRLSTTFEAHIVRVPNFVWLKIPGKFLTEVWRWLFHVCSVIRLQSVQCTRIYKREFDDRKSMTHQGADQTSKQQ